MALFRSTRRLSLKTLLRDTTMMLAGTVMGILLSHMFFTEKGDRVNLASLCGGQGSTTFPHLAKRDGRLVARGHYRPSPRPLPAVWGSIAMGSERVTKNGRESMLKSSAEKFKDNNHPGTAKMLDNRPRTTDYPTQASGDFGSTDITDVASGLLSPIDEYYEAHRPSSRQPLLVGVTLSRTNDNEAIITKTWGTHVQNLMFFSFSEHEEGSGDNLHTVSLSGNNDDDLRPWHVTPYHRLKYIHDRLVNKYDWFMLADDKTYIQVEHLNNLLRELSSNHEQCFSSVDIGGQRYAQEDLKEQTDNYSIWRPGTIFSQALVKKLGPHMETCLMNRTASKSDEDIERCIQQRVGVQCTKSNEMGQLITTDRLKANIFNGVDKFTSQQLFKALVVHPVSEPQLMLRIHHFYVESAISRLKSRTNQLVSELERLSMLTAS